MLSFSLQKQHIIENDCVNKVSNPDFKYYVAVNVRAISHKLLSVLFVGIIATLVRLKRFVPQ